MEHRCVRACACEMEFRLGDAFVMSRTSTRRLLQACPTVVAQTYSASTSTVQRKPLINIRFAALGIARQKMLKRVCRILFESFGADLDVDVSGAILVVTAASVIFQIARTEREKAVEFLD